MTVEVGLRERKKAATRAALAAAANRLAVELGVEHVTVEAIAAAADVSPRTFHNYFSSREEAIVASIIDWAERLTDELEKRPADEPMWDSLQHVFLDSVDESADGHARLIRQLEMIKANPAVIASQLSALDTMRRRFAETIAARTGTDASRDLYPHLIAGAAGHAVKTAMDLWALGQHDRLLRDLVAEAFALVRAGLPEPGRS
ncbi:acyl-CoA-like ligand-binding transcription factor [Jiangella anatolica]|uniref:TetR family transcriptional regulator n=1 Tax=Jiangella anatolica TaxID=2670374 RepID=A0A2W2CJ63_9ACTN|nr:TetR family transcriptional regulator [Jiangella anatolica]PZF80273.1 TetR family transcriptional regulator [Jiangella anatolica]